MYILFTTYNNTTQWTKPSILQLSPQLSILIIIAINHCTMSQACITCKKLYTCGYKQQDEGRRVSLYTAGAIV